MPEKPTQVFISDQFFGHVYSIPDSTAENPLQPASWLLRRFSNPLQGTATATTARVGVAREIPRHGDREPQETCVPDAVQGA